MNKNAFREPFDPGPISSCPDMIGMREVNRSSNDTLVGGLGISERQQLR